MHQARLIGAENLFDFSGRRNASFWRAEPEPIKRVPQNGLKRQYVAGAQ